jgi:two-component system, NarL family, response regulator YdfI
MRIILVGTPVDRTRLRSELEETGVDVVGEFDTLARARAASIHADAVILAREPDSPESRANEPEWIEERLTPREIEVLELLAEGRSNKSIAERLGISDQTVKFHVASISGKLGASNRTEAVRLAVRRGLISL